MWLEKQVYDLINNHKPNPEFIEWLEKVEKELDFIQQGIISWLKNVKDFDYPVSQYKGCMSYFDHLVGEIIKCLKDEGIYENSTIVLVSPHGEILKYDDAVFHHHFPHPNVLSIPMIIKTAGSRYKGRINGVCNLTDLFPTLLELAGIKNELVMDGQGRLENMKTGEPVQNNYSYAYDLTEVLKSVVHPPFFYYRADEDYIITPTKYGKAGEEFLFKLTGDERGFIEVNDNEEMKIHLRQKLDQFV
jgi:arylsulfatase A-like enzyme